MAKSKKKSSSVANTHNKNFGWALTAMKQGQFVSRSKWEYLCYSLVKVNGVWKLMLHNLSTSSRSYLERVPCEDVLAEDWGVHIQNKGGL